VERDRKVNTLQELHESEINFELHGLDDGFQWRLADPLNGYAAHGFAETCEEAITALRNAAIEHYPASKFAREWRRIA